MCHKCNAAVLLTQAIMEINTIFRTAGDTNTVITVGIVDTENGNVIQLANDVSLETIAKALVITANSIPENKGDLH